MSARIFTVLHFAIGTRPGLYECTVFYVAAETSREAENTLRDARPYVDVNKGRLFVQTDGNMVDMDNANCNTTVKQVTPNMRDDRITLGELDRWVEIMTHHSGEDDGCSPRAPIYREVRL